MPSGEFFFTKTKKKQKNVDLASHPRTNIKQYIQVSGCYRRGGRGWVALFLVARLSSPVPCVKPGGEFSPRQAHRTVPLNIQGWSWNGGRATMGKREISPPMGSIVSRNVGKRGSGAG